MSALKELKNNDLSICNHEYKDDFFYHQIDGDNMEIIDILPENMILNSASSRANKKLIFVDQILEEDKRSIKKYKHYCMERHLSIKGRVPKWYTKLEDLLTIKGSRELKPEYKVQFWDKKTISKRLYDETEKCSKEFLITWNDADGDPIFVADKKKSKNKEYKRIGLHLIIKSNLLSNLNDSPFLQKCTGCELNIDNTANEKDECHIYIENKVSRLIKKYVEKGRGIKPYEILNNTIFKNNLIKELEDEDSKNQEFNGQIDLIDKIISGNEETINFLKNCIIKRDDDERLQEVYIQIFIHCTKLKRKLLIKERLNLNF